MKGIDVMEMTQMNEGNRVVATSESKNETHAETTETNSDNKKICKRSKY